MRLHAVATRGYLRPSPAHADPLNKSLQNEKNACRTQIHYSCQELRTESTESGSSMRHWSPPGEARLGFPFLARKVRELSEG
jgi:hypothetical protein